MRDVAVAESRSPSPGLWLPAGTSRDRVRKNQGSPEECFRGPCLVSHPWCQSTGTESPQSSAWLAVFDQSIQWSSSWLSMEWTVALKWDGQIRCVVAWMHVFYSVSCWFLLPEQCVPMRLVAYFTGKFGACCFTHQTDDVDHFSESRRKVRSVWTPSFSHTKQSSQPAKQDEVQSCSRSEKRGQLGERARRGTTSAEINSCSSWMQWSRGQLQTDKRIQTRKEVGSLISQKFLSAGCCGDFFVRPAAPMDSIRTKFVDERKSVFSHEGWMISVRVAFRFGRALVSRTSANGSRFDTRESTSSSSSVSTPIAWLHV